MQSQLFNEIFFNDLIDLWAPYLTGAELWKLRLNKQLRSKIEFWYDMNRRPFVTWSDKLNHLFLMYDKQHKLRWKRVRDKKYIKYQDYFI